ncbi:TetR family transcriptional regulator [Anopheles sinensis]|uniref:TetR family transcriptional regulator n=1 Tax=Anopheles sinensis TaxID=74873 RepID=A0A084W606_ANOSI|nr:TetR family transcriptional regulator [Anopheles sinensis]
MHFTKCSSNTTTATASFLFPPLPTVHTSGTGCPEQHRQISRVDWTDGGRRGLGRSVESRHAIFTLLCVPHPLHAYSGCRLWLAGWLAYAPASFLYHPPLLCG